jgi:hypothetical protein
LIERIFDRLGVEHVDDAFVEGDPGTEREDQKSNDEAPEVELAAMAERMHQVCRLGGTMEAIEQQQAIAGIDERMHTFRQHRRAAGEGCGNEFGHRYRQVAGKGRIDDFLRPAVRSHCMSRQCITIRQPCGRRPTTTHDSRGRSKIRCRSMTDR